ncbi:phosphate ABC transporter permease subunit PstC [Streptomyces sp. PSKA54]|uniref:Phosphate transport system permease protein n=1 Tax=Streptomyces himalayensis subsp. aureolus TaxID=2758039 RepID=A0A7W2HFX6_9ACTN|nr:phosphate ABC transporter permease subunit PstC [Streptomyces himalayensis]MBA4862395.1 phosphate ABC transporter permease subunit PstC [Streptomyces himalayensis subsp. aureolus]
MRSSGSGRRAAAGSPGFLRRSQPRYGEKAIKVLLVAASLVSVLTTVGIVIALIPPAVEFFGKVDFGEFITGTDWSPLFKPPHFGVLPLVTATLLVTLIALLVAVPLGLGAAVYLSEYADPRVRKFFKPVLEVLAGIPTVVYGFFALKAITPLLQNIWPTGDGPQVFNALSAGFVMGIMIIPTIASLAEDAMSAVPRALRDGAFALGSSRMQVSTRVVFPAALSGIVAAIVLGISRALGETMIVAIAAGGRPNLTFNPLEGMQTMTAFIAAAGIGDLPTGSTGYQTIFAVGSLLFAMTLVMNLVSIRLVRKYREVYE